MSNGTDMRTACEIYIVSLSQLYYCRCRSRNKTLGSVTICKRGGRYQIYAVLSDVTVSFRLKIFFHDMEMEDINAWILASKPPS